ncbi:hypothetical protein J4206_03595 [Candidatus Woesearchaeota archaeon]|nr:hypothetical protein [Candidatus Woesearchaeota archaeon]
MATTIRAADMDESFFGFLGKKPRVEILKGLRDDEDRCDNEKSDNCR